MDLTIQIGNKETTFSHKQLKAIEELYHNQTVRNMPNYSSLTYKPISIGNEELGTKGEVEIFHEDITQEQALTFHKEARARFNKNKISSVPQIKYTFLQN